MYIHLIVLKYKDTLVLYKYRKVLLELRYMHRDFICNAQA